MKNYNYAFVILHYNDLDSTIKCIDTLLTTQYTYPINIVVVDNCSPNNSGYMLKEKYNQTPIVYILQTDSNLGFAKANNIGYQYAKKTLNADFICIMNNDVYISQHNFIPISINEYEKSNAGIIGPHITLPNNRVNYMYLKLHPLNYYEKELQTEKIIFNFYSNKKYLPIVMLRNVWHSIHQYFVTLVAKNNTQMIAASKIRHENIVLHGCCLIFTPLYILKHENAFNPNTYMFREEELLFLHCEKHGIKTVYDPSLSILHMEDISTNTTFKKINERELWRSKCQIDSLTLLINELSNKTYGV